MNIYIAVMLLSGFTVVVLLAYDLIKCVDTLAASVYRLSQSVASAESSISRLTDATKRHDDTTRALAMVIERAVNTSQGI